MQKIDFKKAYKPLYQPSAKRPSIVTVPTFNYLMIDGHGDPNSAESYVHAVEALYAVAYTIRFAVKAQLQIAYSVMPLQGLWWVDDMTQFSDQDKSAWDWTMMIMQPDFVSAEMVDAAIADTKHKKDPAALPLLRFEPYDEGLAVQILYIGPYADEGPTIERLHQFAWDNGYQLGGKHHEIYLSDPRRTDPTKLKTIIRQPVTIK